MLFLTVVKPWEIAWMKNSFHNYEKRISSQNSLLKFLFSVLINLCKISLLLDTSNFYTHAHARTHKHTIVLQNKYLIFKQAINSCLMKGFFFLLKNNPFSEDPSNEQESTEKPSWDIYCGLKLESRQQASPKQQTRGTGFRTSHSGRESFWWTVALTDFLVIPRHKWIEVVSSYLTHYMQFTALNS